MEKACIVTIGRRRTLHQPAAAWRKMHWRKKRRVFACPGIERKAGGKQRLVQKLLRRAEGALRPGVPAGMLQIARSGFYSSIISKSDLSTPQSGQDQSSGMSSQRVPAAMPSLGKPLSSS